MVMDGIVGQAVGVRVCVFYETYSDTGVLSWGAGMPIMARGSEPDSV